jgi:hypothetical protein
MIVSILVVITLISYQVHGSLQIIPHAYPLMHFAKLMSEEYFTPGRPVVIMLPLAEEDSTNKEAGYLIEEMHASNRWPILVFNVTRKMNGTMFIEINKHGSYIILVSGPCEEWKEHVSRFSQQLLSLSDGTTWQSWNPAATFIVSVMSNCTHVDNTLISRAILDKLWCHEVPNATVLFLISNEPGGKDHQQSTTDLAQGMHLEMHTWHPYENSQKCNPVEGTVPVKVFTAQSLSDIRSSEVFKRYFGTNLHKCPIRVNVFENPPRVNPPKRVWYNDSVYQKVYENGWEIEQWRIIGQSLNMSLDIYHEKECDYRSGTACIFVGGYGTLPSLNYSSVQFTRSYINVRYAWYMPCAVKYQRWSRFFKIFSTNMWISFALSLVLPVITVSCLSKCGHKSHLHESQSYSNILSITTNIIAILLSVSVNTQPRTAPLRVFFFCWVCYSVAISTVFQAYLTTYLIEPGYEEPIKTADEMLKSEMKLGFLEFRDMIYEDILDRNDLKITRDAVQCPDYQTCFTWATVYRNVSILLDDLRMELYRGMGNWMDENNRPLLCELEGGDFANFLSGIIVMNANPFLEYINRVVSRIEEAGIFVQMKRMQIYSAKLEGKALSYTFVDTYIDMNITHMQTAFYILLFGHVLAGVCLVMEVTWYRLNERRGKNQVQRSAVIKTVCAARIRPAL